METCFAHGERNPQEKKKAHRMDGFLRLILNIQHNSYFLVPETEFVKEECTSDYQKSLMNDLEMKSPDSEKLLLTLEDKSNFIDRALKELAVLFYCRA